jgi:hypothetical protein
MTYIEQHNARVQAGWCLIHYANQLRRSGEIADFRVHHDRIKTEIVTHVELVRSSLVKRVATW